MDTSDQLQTPAERPTFASFEEEVRYLLNRLILETTKTNLAREFALLINRHPTTVSDWMRNGDVPRVAAQELERTFGAELAPANRLSKTLRFNV